MKALLVGLGDATAELVKHVLSGWGDETCVADDATSVLRLTDEGCASLVVVAAPSSEELTAACRLLREAACCRDATIVAVSSAPDATDLRELLEAGANDFLLERLGEAVLRSRLVVARKMATESVARREAEHDRDRFFDMSLDLLCVAGSDGFFRRLNPAWTSTLGWSRDELRAKQWIEFVHVDDIDATIAAGAQLSDGASIIAFANRYRCKDGSYRWLEWRAVPSPGRGTIYAVARDTTDQRMAQKKMILNDRMASVGTLAAGVAHEINNPLTYVTANLEMVIEEIRVISGGSSSGRMKELEEMATEALNGADRVRKIVRGLKTFSRVEEEKPSVIAVTPVLELAINMCFNEIRPRARLVKDYSAIPLVDADDARLGQVFVNLIVNAAHAIGDGNAETNEIRLSTSTDESGRAIIEVRDTGRGIDPTVLSRVFDPFFTTKPVGVGTGLGLSICHHIVTGMKGEISVNSEVGKGTTFRVALPAATASPNMPATPAENSTRTARRAAVLVVDDEPALGIALRRVLREHDVTLVTSAADALQLVTSGNRYDVILSDLMMPEMSGMDLYEALVVRDPGAAQRMVFVTGGAFTPDAHAFLARVTNERLDKPFAPKAIRALVESFIK